MSKSVLEHVRLVQVDVLLSEMKRVLSHTGTAVHLVDLRDHMYITGDNAVNGDWLDALQYPRWLFESMFSHRSTSINRLRLPEWLALFERTGFEIVDKEEFALPLPPGFWRNSLQLPWRSWDDEELTVAVFSVVLRKNYFSDTASKATAAVSRGACLH